MRPSSVLLALVLSGCSATWAPVADTGDRGLLPPEVYLTSPELGSTWEGGAPIPVRAVVTDDVDAPATLIVEIRSDLQGVVATPELTSDGQLDTTVTLDPGTHQLTVAAIDAAGLEGTDVHTIRVLDVGDISQPVVDVEPEEPVTGEDLVARVIVDAVDPEGDALEYVWSWTVDGDDAGVVEDTVSGTMVDAGQTWTVTVYATDGEHSSPAASATVVVLNGPPDPGDVWISPENPAEGDTLTCNHGQVVDPEGDAYTQGYAWWVDGVERPETGPELDATGIERGSWVYCEVVVDDGVEARFPSESVQVGNGAPTVGGVSISPSAADASTTLTCRATGATDPDGDPVALAYRWDVGGATVGTGATLSGAFVRGDTVVCEVTPTDGFADGAPVASAGLLIDNAAPSAPTVGFLRADLIPGVEAECAVLADGADPDGDALAYRWSWEVDGVAVAGASSTFDTTDLDAGATLACVATPDDGFDAGAPGRAALTLGTPTTGDLTTGDAFVTIGGSSASGSFGKALDAVGDLDGDGLSELVVSAPAGNGSSKGAAYVFTAAQLAVGGTLADTDATWWWTGHASGDALGGARAVAGAGDVDDDGTADLLLGAPLADTGGSEAGTVYLLHGGEAWTVGGDAFSDADARFYGAAGDWLGARMAGGDLDGDGISDVVLTAPYNDEGGNKAGVAAVWFGAGARLSGTYQLDDADALVTGSAANSELGWALDVMGDVNADGYADLGVGLIYDDTNGADAGTAAVMSGGELVGTQAYDEVAFLVVHGTEAGARFGYDVTGLGDVDGDGFEDVAMGAYLSDDAGADSGRVRILHGAAGLDREIDEDAADATLVAEAAGDQFGSVLLDLGDLDADGVHDLLAGGPRASAGSGGTNSGTAYVFLGRDHATWGDAADAAIRVFGAASGDWLSDEAAGGLDLDGDGYGDFALGAQKADGAATDAGAVYVYKGP